MSGGSTGLFAKAVREGLWTRETLRKRRISLDHLLHWEESIQEEKCFEASSRVEILLTFSYLFSLLSEHMFHHSFISKWRIHYCPKSVVWLALLNGRFCVTHVYFISLKPSASFWYVLLREWETDSKGVHCHFSYNGS